MKESIVAEKVQPNDQNIYGKSYIETYRKKEGEGRIERLIEHISPRKQDKVLDVGCGLDFLYLQLEDKIAEYTGVDENKSFIDDSIRRQGPNNKKRKFIWTSLKDYLAKNKGEKYDKIFLLDVTEHLIDFELLETLELCHNALNKKGKLFIHTPNGNYFLERLKNKAVLKQTLGHVGVRNDSQYRDALKKTPFKAGKIETKYLNHYITKLKPLHLLSYLPLVGKYFEARLLIVCQRGI